MFKRFNEIIPVIDIGKGALSRAEARIKGPALLVMDVNTRAAAGSKLCADLSEHGVAFDVLCFPRCELTADEYALGAVIAAYKPEHKLLVAVGSGTINDLCKYASYKLGKPFIVIGTAPSMDGYASAGAAMTLGGLKVTPQTHCPQAVYCDTDVLKNAPLHMLAAGLGDMLGKITALADWELSHLLVGEPIPEDIYSIVKQALDAVIANIDAASRRDGGAIERVTEGLILSGIAMTLYGDSRPASGTEHHLSHYWEMRCLAEGRKPAAHGLKVGVAALCALRMWKSLPKMLERPAPARCIDDLITEKYGAAARDIMKTQNPDIPFDHIEREWPQILAIADTLPDPDVIEGYLRKLSAPVKPVAVGVNGVLLREGILLARERKKTYTLLQLLGGLGLLYDTGEAVEKAFADEALSKVKCFVLDMDGTIYLDGDLFPYTKSFILSIKDNAKDFIFFTNNSSKNRNNYLEKLMSMGISVTKEKMLLSTDVILDFLKRERAGKTVWVSGTPELLDAFRESGIEPLDECPDIVILGFDKTLDYEKLHFMHKAICGGAEFLAVHEDLVCPMPDGSIPDCGAMSAALTKSTGVSPRFFGKPRSDTLDYICRKTGYVPNELCFIGDRLYTDIAIANGTEAMSILVLSGESAAEDLRNFPNACPDMVVNNIGEIRLP